MSDKLQGWTLLWAREKSRESISFFVSNEKYVVAHETFKHIYLTREQAQHWLDFWYADGVIGDMIEWEWDRSVKRKQQHILRVTLRFPDRKYPVILTFRYAEAKPPMHWLGLDEKTKDED